MTNFCNSDNMKLKIELLKNVMPEFALDSALKSHLAIGKDGEKKYESCLIHFGIDLETMFRNGQVGLIT